MTISRQELGRRIKEAREACKMTQEVVAKYLGVSRSTVSQIETGARSVTGIELSKLAYLFGRGMNDFFRYDFPREDALVAIFRAHPQLCEEEDIKEAIRKCLALGRELTNLERILDVDRDNLEITKYRLKYPANHWEALKQGEDVAGEERRRLGLGLVPVPDICDFLESQGVRTGQIRLPEEVSGLTIIESGIGHFVVANNSHHYLRRRFSFAHEYCHVLLDREKVGIVSTQRESKELIEVRANSFAACFLMPEGGVNRFINDLGKGNEKRCRAEVFDGSGASRPVQARSVTGSQDIQLYEVAQLAHHFGVSRIAALYRLRNLRLITESQFGKLKEQDERKGREIALALGLGEPDHQAARGEFRRRFLGLGIEAFRQKKITRAKLVELAKLVDVSDAIIEGILEDYGVDDEDKGVGVRLPGEQNWERKKKGGS